MNTGRRNFIRNSTLIATSSFIPIPLRQKSDEKSVPDNDIIGHGDFKYKVVRDWAKISVNHNPLNNCHEMQMDRKGRLFMIGDHTNNNILIFDKSGKLLDYWGTNFPGGHGLTLVDEGDEEFLFITDCGYFIDNVGQWRKQSGVVYKTTLDGRLLFTLPDPRTIGIYSKDEEYMPTETAIGPNGDIYVADGYGSSYILQFNYMGEFIRKWGGTKNADENYNIHEAHGIAIDNRDIQNPKLIITARTSNAFKYFTLDGKYISTIKLPGAFVCRPVIDDQNIYAGVCWSETKEGEKWVRDTGFVTILDGNDHVVSNPGGNEPTYINGTLQKMTCLASAVFNHGHDVLVDEDKNLYVCQWNAHHSPPIKLIRT